VGTMVGTTVTPRSRNRAVEAAMLNRGEDLQALDQLERSRVNQVQSRQADEEVNGGDHGMREKAPAPTVDAKPPVDAPWPSHAGLSRLPVRIPYRASMLTRVLRDCFADESHRTAIVAAVAPGSQSVIHTLNTLDHVIMMAPHLFQHSCEVDVPMVGADGTGFSYEGTPVHEWSAEQVIEWLSNAEGGRFSQVVVPKGTEGKDLLRLNARRLTEFVESEQAGGREDGEGWYVSTQARVGRALFQALRDAQRQAPIKRGGPPAGHLGSLQAARRTEQERRARLT